MEPTIPSSQQNSVPLHNESGAITAHLQLQECDPIFADTFQSMITEAFSQGKHFFVARITSRQDQSNQDDVQAYQTHSHLFNAYGIMKLIFKKKGRSGFVGRYHDVYPIHAKNPITNAVSPDKL